MIEENWKNAAVGKVCSVLIEQKNESSRNLFCYFFQIPVGGIEEPWPSVPAAWKKTIQKNLSILQKMARENRLTNRQKEQSNCT